MDTNYKSWFLYLIRYDEKGFLYTGVTLDVQRRLKEHKSGKTRAAKVFRGKKQLELVYQCEIGDQTTALQLEYRIKRIGKANKEELVLDQPDLPGLLLMLDALSE